MQRSNMFQSAVMAEDVRFLTERTIYSRIGDLVGWLSRGADARGAAGDATQGK